MSILSLPDELKVAILAVAGSVDLRTLANAAQTCRALRRVIHQDQMVWREIHLLEYDDPRKACTFLTPRPEYDWKQRVIDRDFVTTYLSLHPSPDYEQVFAYIERIRPPPNDIDPNIPDDPHPVVQHTPRVLKTVLDLYLDLPALVPGTSRNVVILETIVKSKLFGLMCVTVGSPNVSERLVATLLHSSKRFRRHVRGWSNFLQYHRGLYTDEDVLPKDQVYWDGLAAELSFAANNLMGKEALKGEKQIDSRLARRAISDGIDSVRGLGILGLQRPGHLDKDTVWDWAHVRGEWYGIQTLEKTARLGGGVGFYRPLCEVPDSFNISPTTTLRKLKAYEAFGMRDPPLPPVYFSGTSQRPKDGGDMPSPKSIFGLVHLTSDDPPELRWTAAIINRARRDRSIIFQGVQVGGPGARRGVFGAFMYWDCKDDDDEPPVVDFHARSDGMVWLFKIDGKRKKSSRA